MDRDRHAAAAGILLTSLLACAPARADQKAEGDANLADYQRQLKELKDDDLRALSRLFKWCLQQKLFKQAAEVGDKIIACKDLTVRQYKLLAVAYCRAEKPTAEDQERQLLLELSSGFKALKSNHYLVLYDGEPDFAEGRIEWLEKGAKNFYLYLPEIGIYPRFLPNRLVAIVFDDGKGYNHYGAQRGVPPYMTSGFYSMLDNRLAIYNEKKGTGYLRAQEAVEMQKDQVRNLNSQLVSIPGTDHVRITFTRSDGRVIHTTKGQMKQALKKEYAKLKDLQDRFRKIANYLNVSKTLHEGAHQLAFNVGVQKRMAPYPLWVAEGLATVFETAGDMTGWGPRRVNPQRHKRLKQLIEDGKARSVLQIAGFDGRFKDSEDAFNLYAESWGLFFYLLRMHPDELKAYLEDLRTRESETIEVKFEPGKTNVKEIEKKLEELYKKWKNKEVELFEKHFGKYLEMETRRFYRFIKDLRG